MARERPHGVTDAAPAPHLAETLEAVRVAVLVHDRRPSPDGHLRSGEGDEAAQRRLDAAAIVRRYVVVDWLDSTVARAAGPWPPV